MATRLLLAVLVTLVALPGAANAATGAEVAARLSAQREAHGIPGGITENPDWSAKCAKHVAWMRLNRRVVHGEEPGTPGYSEDGDWAGRNSDLAAGSLIDFNRGNPYLTAPYHLLALLHPALETLGAAEENRDGQGLGCHTTFPGHTRPAPANDTFYSYPGDSATIAWFEQARESPSVPGDAVGLPEGTITGPNMEVFWRGPNGPDGPPSLDNLVSASLSDASGSPVEVRTVGVPQDSLVIRGTGFVIPARPLRPGSNYSATATFRSDDGSREFSGSWSFTTSPLPLPEKAVKVKLSNSKTQGLLVTLTGQDVYAERLASVTVDYGKGYSKLKTKIPLNNVLQATPLKKGRTVKVTATVKAFSIGGIAIPGAKVVKRLKAQ
jgi:hypothetical protein